MIYGGSGCGSGSGSDNILPFFKKESVQNLAF
jgi:hypothetical protein